MLDTADILIEKEDAYVAMPTTEDDIVFAISVKDESPDTPQLLYDKEDHALLMRNKGSAVILDYLNSEIQEMLQVARKVFIAEIDYKEKRLVRDYEVPVEFVKRYPVDLKPYFD